MEPRPFAVFDTLEGRQQSRYYALAAGRLVPAAEGVVAPSPAAQLAYDTLRGMLLSSAYPCLGARAAFLHEEVRFGFYEQLDDALITPGLCRDLALFVEERERLLGKFATFVACFESPSDLDAEGFERRLWGQLQRLHEGEQAYFGWDPAVSSDPQDPHFAFSFAGCAFFVAGLFGDSPRYARRFPWPLLVFNAHAQFERLRAEGKFAAFRNSIRARDTALQGGPNPALSDWGRGSEAQQYAGRQVPPGWRCPFRPNVPEEPDQERR